MPRKAFPSPTGIATGTAARPKAAWTFSSARSKEAFSRSIRFTTMRRARSYSSANAHTFSVWTSTPATASTTTRAASTTRRAARASDRKLAYPGASIRLTLLFFHSAKARAARRLILRSISSGSKSVTVVPSSTRPSRFTAPASKSRAEASEVFPQPPCPTSATLRMFGAS